jgi:hypothetical protein
MAAASNTNLQDIVASAMWDYLKKNPQCFSKSKVIGMKVDEKNGTISDVVNYTPHDFDVEASPVEVAVFKRKDLYGVVAADLRGKHKVQKTLVWYIRKKKDGELETFVLDDPELSQ